jgi:hypothetical protein
LEVKTELTSSTVGSIQCGHSIHDIARHKDANLFNEILFWIIGLKMARGAGDLPVDLLSTGALVLYA